MGNTPISLIFLEIDSEIEYRLHDILWGICFTLIAKIYLSGGLDTLFDNLCPSRKYKIPIPGWALQEIYLMYFSFKIYLMYLYSIFI